VDWIKVQAGNYAIVDPNDPGYILYISDVEYREYWKVAQSNRKTLVVLARPNELKPADSLITAPKPTSPNSPAFYFRLSKVYSRVARALWSSAFPDGSVAPSKRNLRSLFSLWGNSLRLWTGHRQSSAYLATDSIAVTRHLSQILKDKGPLGLVLYLKTSLTVVNRYLAGQPLTNTWELKMAVGISSGLPSWIPVEARSAIRSRSKPVIRVWTSLLYTYKCMKAEGKLSIQSVTAKRWTVDRHLQSEFFHFVRDVYIPHFKLKEAFKLNPTAFLQPPISTSGGPNGPSMKGAGLDAWNLTNTSEGKDILRLIQNVISWYPQPTDKRTRNFVTEFQRLLSELAPKGKPDSAKPRLGKIALLREAAGKVRVIGMLDYFSQWALRPLHTALADVLKFISQDGTHDQDHAVRSFCEEMNLAGERWFSSLDISSATDTIPYQMYEWILTAFGVPPRVSESILSLLRDRTYHTGSPGALGNGIKFTIPPLLSPVKALAYLRDMGVPIVKEGLFSDAQLELARYTKKQVAKARLQWSKIPKAVMYGRGQPMGAYSSFPLLGLWHHCFIQFAAFQVGKFPFTEYRVLGDDSVIADSSPEMPVANAYLGLASKIGIPIHPLKSFRSKSFWTFASRSFLEGSEVTPLSVKAEMSVLSVSARVEFALSAISKGWVSEGPTHSNQKWLSGLVRVLCDPFDYWINLQNLKEGRTSYLVSNLLAAALVPIQQTSLLLATKRPPVSGWMASIRGSSGYLSAQADIRSGNYVPGSRYSIMLMGVVGILWTRLATLIYESNLVNWANQDFLIDLEFEEENTAVDILNARAKFPSEFPTYVNVEELNALFDGQDYESFITKDNRVALHKVYNGEIAITKSQKELLEMNQQKLDLIREEVRKKDFLDPGDRIRIIEDGLCVLLQTICDWPSTQRLKDIPLDHATSPLQRDIGARFPENAVKTAIQKLSGVVLGMICKIETSTWPDEDFAPLPQGEDVPGHTT
jgi:hypothetical protein